MSDNALKDYIWIGITLLIAVILMIIPMPPWAVWLRPNWLMATLIFWLMTSPHRIGIFFAWFLGLFMDVLIGNVLGEQALIYCITAFFVLKFQNWLSYIPVLQQTAMVFLLILLGLIIDRCLLVVFLHSSVDWSFWLPALTTAVIWPWLSGLLYVFQIKLRVSAFS